MTQSRCGWAVTAPGFWVGQVGLATPWSCSTHSPPQLGSARERGNRAFEGIFWKCKGTKKTQIIFYRCCCLWQKSRSNFQHFTPPLISALSRREEGKPPRSRPQPCRSSGCSRMSQHLVPSCQALSSRNLSSSMDLGEGKGGEKVQDWFPLPSNVVVLYIQMEV